MRRYHSSLPQDDALSVADAALISGDLVSESHVGSNMSEGEASMRKFSFDSQAAFSPSQKETAEYRSSFSDSAQRIPIDPRKIRASLRDSLHDARFWTGLVTRLGYDRSTYHCDTIPSLDNLSRYFESSERGLMRVFKLFDKDQDSLLGFDEICRVLQQQGLYTDMGRSVADEAVQQLWRLITPARSGTEVQPPEFLWALRNLRLAALISGRNNQEEFQNSLKESKSLSALSLEDTTEEPIKSWNVHSFEYCADKLISRSPVGDPESFMFEPGYQILDEMDVKWVHVHDGTKRLILALAVKYGLDSRFVLDIFTLWREHAKVVLISSEVRGSRDTLFLVTPVIRLTSRSMRSLLHYRDWRSQLELLKRSGKKAGKSPRVIVEPEHSNLCIIVRADKKHVISFTSEWGVLSKIITDDIQDEALTAELYSSNTHLDLSVFRAVDVLLNTPYSILRTGDCQTLILKSLCGISEDLRFVSEAYDAATYVLQKRLEHQRDRTSLSDIRRMGKGIRQLSHLYRLVRPLANVAGSLGRFDLGEDAGLYVSEISSSVQGFLDSTVSSRSQFQQMLADYRAFKNRRVTKFVFALTTVFTVCAPGQFLAAVYGMNFKDEVSGTPTVPELNWSFGYLFYWMMVITITSLLVVFIYYKRRAGWVK